MLRKCLFWTLIPFMVMIIGLIGVLAIVAQFFFAVHDVVMEVLHSFEAWAYDYKADGWKHVGDGIYRQGTDNEQK